MSKDEWIVTLTLIAPGIDIVIDANWLTNQMHMMDPELANDFALEVRRAFYTIRSDRRKREGILTGWRQARDGVVYIRGV
jgi:hypothetical protein